MNLQSVFIGDMTAPELEKRAAEATAVILPLGSVEVLGHHGPTGLDNLVASAVAESVARKTGCLVAPTIPYGDTMEFGNLPGTVHVPAPVLEEYIYAVAKSLFTTTGCKAIVFLAAHSLNCHAATAVCRRLTMEGYKVLLADWWPAAGSAAVDILEDKVTGRGHGSEMITSVAMALCPQLIDMEAAQIEPEAPALHEVNRWGGTAFKTFGHFGQYCQSGAWGRMDLATAQKGEEILRRGIEQICTFVHEALNH